MPTIQCPIEGFEVKVTFPDEWLMKHIDQFYLGLEQAPKGAAPSTREIYGTIALCEEIEGLDLKNVGEMPLSHRPFFVWLVREIYLGNYLKAITVPNESLLAQQTTPSE